MTPAGKTGTHAAGDAPIAVPVGATAASATPLGQSRAASGRADHQGVGVRRVMGMECEYGISVPGDPSANPMYVSGLVVGALGQVVAPVAGVRVAAWDYEGEAPLDDVRGWRVQRDHAHPGMLTDEGASDPRVANCATANGARFYVDHAHPEYSGPECLTPREAITWDRAGEQLAAAAADAVTATALGHTGSSGKHIVLYKNNTDGKGASYGTHENYLVPRSVPFENLVEGLLPFLVTRQVITGAGRVGLGVRSQLAGFQIGARSDFMEALVGLETTFLRPLVNTRDEPHADGARHRRLHLIGGDANMCDVAGLLKVGMTSLVLGLIEAGRVPAGLTLTDPLAEVRALSRDLDGSHRLALTDGRRLSAVQILRAYWQASLDYLTQVHGPGGGDADTQEVLRLWDEVLDGLAGDRFALADRLDWVAKLALLESYRERDQLSWDDPRLAAIDIQWSDLRPGKGLARLLESRGRIVRLIPQPLVEQACVQPPVSTRAWFRGSMVARFAQTQAASWQSVTLDLPDSPRVLMADPYQGSRAALGDLIERYAPTQDAAGLVAALAHADSPVEGR